MGKRSERLCENGHWITDQVGEADVVDSEDNDGMEVGIDTSDVGRKDGDGLGDRYEFSRLRLSRFRHIG